MIKVNFSKSDWIQFDPLNVKFYHQTGELITFNNNHNTDPDCSKVRNQMHTHMHQNTRFVTPKTLRISLGHACNFRCKYCAQTHQKKSTITTEQLQKLYQELFSHLDLSQLKLIQFWGGEPLLYWNEIKWLMEKFKKDLSPNIGFSMVTNGSLMTDEITEYLVRETQFGFILSHDGPGQSLRGIDPLRKGSTTREALLKLAYAKINHTLDPQYASQGRNFAVNPVITTKVKSLSNLINYYDQTFEIEVPIAESIPVVPILHGTDKYVLHGDDLKQYTWMMVKDLLSIGLHRFDNYRLLYDLFLQKISLDDFTVNPVKALCFTTDPYMLTVDINGNILPCQTFATTDILDNGDHAHCGTLKDIFQKKLTMPTVHGYQSRGNKCLNCPVVSFCMGGCPYLIGKNHEIDCKVKYHHFLGLLLTYTTMIFGKQPTTITKL